MRFTIGADPEVFFKDKNGLASAIGLIGGSKYEPKKAHKDISLSEDNVLGEYAISPCKTLDEFQFKIALGLNLLREIAEKNNLSIATCSSGLIQEEYLENQKAHEFGCEPDICVYTGEINQPDAQRDPRLRSAGGHVHIGFDQERIDLFRLVTALDCTLGAYQTLHHFDPERTKLYGKSGTVRFKDYGVEYRTPNNFWIFEPGNVELVYMAVVRSLTLAEDTDIRFPPPNLIRKTVDKRVNPEELLKRFWPEVLNPVKVQAA